MYLQQLSMSKKNNYINSEQHLILVSLFESFENENDRDLTRNISNIIDNCYNKLFNETKNDLKIYEVIDSKIYPKNFTKFQMLCLDNLECLMQTQSLSPEQIFQIKKLLKKEVK